LVDIATKHISSKEAVGAIFIQGDEKAAPNSAAEISAGSEPGVSA
jgi:hypothetical protein